LKRTRKWAFVAQEATRLASAGMEPKAIADRLGVNRSTVTRWMQEGKIARTVPRTVDLKVKPGQPPKSWAKAVRAAYDLDATDDQLVTLAELALSMSRDSKVKPHIRMTAAGRYQALVRQLALGVRGAVADVEPDEPEAEATAAEPARRRNPERPQRAAGDPRSPFLTAVK
jgi:transposase